jgi:hypothetical protein
MVKLMGGDAVVVNYGARIARDTSTMEVIQRAVGQSSEQLATLTVQAGEQDADNDQGVGDFDDGAQLALRVCEDDTLREQIRVAYAKAMAASRTALVLGPYAGASGEAKRIEQSLTADDWAALRKAKIADTNLEVILKRCLKGLHALTAIEVRRAALQAAQDDTRVSDGDVAAARNQWVRTMNGFVAVVRSSDLDAAAQEALLAFLTAAEQSADAAAAARRAAVTP